MRILSEELIHAVARQVDERLVGENDRIARQGGVGHEHRHAGPANGFHEQATLLPYGFDVPFGDGPLGGINLVLLELVHGQPRMM